MHNENYKALIKNIKGDINKEKDITHSRNDDVIC